MRILRHLLGLAHVIFLGLSVIAKAFDFSNALLPRAPQGIEEHISGDAWLIRGSGKHVDDSPDRPDNSRDPRRKRGRAPHPSNKEPDPGGSSPVTTAGLVKLFEQTDEVLASLPALKAEKAKQDDSNAWRRQKYNHARAMLELESGSLALAEKHKQYFLKDHRTRVGLRMVRERVRTAT